MLVLFAASAIASAPPQGEPGRPVAASVQARAMIRVISGVELHFGEAPPADGFVARDSIVRSAGATEAAKLIEFE